MAISETHDRARRYEDDYFRRRDAELIAKARAAAARPEPDTASRQERTRLGDALGLHAPHIIEPLYEAGLRSGTIGLLEWLPAIEVAWIDGVDAREREELSRQFEATAGPDGLGVSLLNEWLYGRPPHEAMIAAKQALRHQLDQLDADTRQDALRRIASRCEVVGRVSGGWFGIGTLSDAERTFIERVREDLGDATVSDNVLPGEIPH